MTQTEERGNFVSKEGKVISNKMDKTVIVLVERTVRHSVYEKVIKRSKKYYAHSEEPLEIGETVTIAATRPYSKLKRWRVVSKH
jgi:small subunit ribosomal protein S17